MSKLEPVSREDILRLQELDKARRDIALRLLAIERQKVRILGADRRISDEWDGLFQRIVSERDLPEGTEVEVNFQTGELSVADPPADGEKEEEG